MHANVLTKASTHHIYSEHFMMHYGLWLQYYSEVRPVYSRHHSPTSFPEPQPGIVNAGPLFISKEQVVRWPVLSTRARYLMALGQSMTNAKPLRGRYIKVCTETPSIVFLVCSKFYSSEVWVGKINVITIPCAWSVLQQKSVGDWMVQESGRSNSDTVKPGLLLCIRVCLSVTLKYWFSIEWV